MGMSRLTPGCCCDDSSSSSSSESINPCEQDLSITAKGTYALNVSQDLYQLASNLWVRGHSALSGTYEYTFHRTGGNFTKMPVQFYSEVVASTEYSLNGGPWTATNTSIVFVNNQDPGSITPASVPNLVDALISIAAGGSFYRTRFFHFICLVDKPWWFSTANNMSLESWTRNVVFNDFSGNPIADATFSLELIQL
jgi:hypothetical protein